MRVVTWNVNSIRAREERVKAFLARANPDLLCVQETKVDDPVFPFAAYEGSGYEISIFGQKTYNGVALFSKRPLTEVVRGFPGAAADAGKRLIAASLGDLRVVNAYVPNGQEVGADKYRYKLSWLEQYAAFVRGEILRHPAVLLVGDFNITPDDRDVHDPEAWRGKILCSEPERAALRSVMELGFEDLFRKFVADPGHHSWWDYRNLGFQKKLGLRIDLVLGSKVAAERCRAVTIDREERKGAGASDHAPVIADLDQP